jgi:DNA polymerase III delta prime subunit
MTLRKLWVEAYRPKKIVDVIFANDKERKVFESIIEEKSLPNLLLIGTQGTGKTSLSNALLHELGVLPEDTLRINCSDEKIDAIREKVKTFAYTMALGDFKVCQLEEMDHLSLDAQALLRALIEDVSSSCRFIATGNYENKIIPAMHSRFQVFRFSRPDREQVLLRMADVLVAENIEFEVDDLEKVVEAGYPDVRKVLQLLEAGSKSGKLAIQGEGAVADWKLQLLPLLETGDLKGARTLVCTSASKEELQDVYRFLYDNIHRIKKLKGKEDQAVILIAQYQYQHAFVADPEIQVAALFIEMGALS